MNLLRRFLFLSMTVVISAMMAEVPSCRTLKAGMTACDPYATSFLKLEVLKRSVERLRHQPITKKSIPITKKIRVKNSITLNSLISKYIKREERLYDKAEEERREEAPPAEPVTEVAVAPAPVVKTEPPPVQPAEKTEETSPVEENLTEIVIEKGTPVDENQSMTERSETVPETIVLAPPVPEPSIPSSVLEEENITHEERGEMTYPVKRLPNVNKTSPVLTEETREEKNPSTEQEKEVFAHYVVKKGDSLQRIAKRFDIDSATLAKINNLKPRSLLKVGQKLRMPLSQERIDTIDNAFYIVRKGDTLSRIAKRFHVKVRDLKKYNKIRKKSIIHIGQGLVLPVPHKLAQLKKIEAQKKKERLRKKRERERLARIALKKAKKAKFLKASKGLKRKLSVTATAYTSHRGQTDRTPFLAAWNNRIRPGMKVIAVSRDLIYKYGITNGSKVRISGLPGIYTVRDKMNKKWRRKIDIYMGTNRWKALRWGRRRVTLYY